MTSRYEGAAYSSPKSASSAVTIETYGLDIGEQLMNNRQGMIISPRQQTSLEAMFERGLRHSEATDLE